MAKTSGSVSAQATQLRTSQLKGASHASGMDSLAILICPVNHVDPDACPPGRKSLA